MWNDRVQYFSNGVAPNLPPGPWNGEPDKVQWVDQATDLPLPGRAAEVWWFGFDCGHYMDLVPGMMAYSHDGEYRDAEYVRGSVEALARQLAGEVAR